MSDSDQHPLVLVRHGETEWSREHRHTGRTNIPLTQNGESEARRIAGALKAWDFAHGFVSPLARARRTAEVSGVSCEFRVLDELMEWDYGIYEGRTTAHIQAELPTWNKWFDEMEGGETVEHVGERADRATSKIVDGAADGPVVVFAHGHLLAVLIARWLDLAPSEGRRFVLDTSTISMLGMKREDRVIQKLNVTC